jgi:hypothetical protein
MSIETTVTAKEAQADLDYSGAVMCHVHYGRGFPPSPEEEIGNVITAFRFAAALTGAEKIFLITDGEDVGFAPSDSTRTWGDDEGRLLSPDSLLFDQSIENETHALLAYWENYGFAGGEQERTFRVRDMVAERVDIDPRHLMPPQ